MMRLCHFDFIKVFTKNQKSVIYSQSHSEAGYADFAGTDVKAL